MNFKIADFGGKECAVVKEKKYFLCAPFFSSVNSRSRKRKKGAEKMQND